MLAIRTAATHIKTVRVRNSGSIAATSVVKACTEVTQHNDLPVLRLANESLRNLSQDKLAQLPFADPFWAFVWPGSFALTKYLQENNGILKNCNVIDFGSGCGVSAIAAANKTSGTVIANDIDEFALAATWLNSELNQVKIQTKRDNLIGFSNEELRNLFAKNENNTQLTLLCGDMFYETQLGVDVAQWFAELSRDDSTNIIIGDPGRHALPPNYLKVASYPLPKFLRDDNSGLLSTFVYTLKTQ